MTKSKKSVFALVIAVATMAVLASSLSLSNTAEAQSGKIPEWIQNIALFWGEGQISESEFVGALEFLGDEGILKLPAAKSAEAQEISSSISELEQRIEEVEVKQASESTTSTRDSEPEDSSYPTTYAICPSDKIRHFDKIHFKLNLGMNQGVHSSEGYDSLYSSRTNIVILEERYDEVGLPFGAEERLVSHLHELGYSYLLNDETQVGIPLSSVEILDVEYAVICANKPGISQSSGTLGYK
jgi:hypothetical protein